MKLNYKRTLLVGMAFFLISAFWQAYDAIVPLILTNHFGLPQLASGGVMSLDNVLAVFLLPFFGALSDRVDTKIGRRTPFILGGSLAAMASFVGLTFIDNYQLARLNALAPEGDQTALAEVAWRLTRENPLPFWGFAATLLVVLLAMATFRSPAVALMPDVTVKPLRSGANALINLAGTAGGILVLALGLVFSTSKALYRSYTGYAVAVTGVMLTGLFVFLATVRERKWSAEMEAEARRLGLDEPADSPESAGGGRLSRPELTSLLLILASVALWYVGYNSITSKYSVYATSILGFDYNFTLIIAQLAAIAAYIPVGMVASRVGRRRTVLGGILLLTAAFLLGIFIAPPVPSGFMYLVFILAGIGWATINVNSFPMVVELAKRGDVGRYTGYYYTASMSAQIAAPLLSGLLYDLLGMRYVFFPFGAVFVALSFVTMFFVKHGDTTLPAKRSALERLDAGEP